MGLKIKKNPQKELSNCPSIYLRPVYYINVEKLSIGKGSENFIFVVGMAFLGLCYDFKITLKTAIFPAHFFFSSEFCLTSRIFLGIGATIRIG